MYRERRKKRAITTKSNIIIMFFFRNFIVADYDSDYDSINFKPIGKNERENEKGRRDENYYYNEIEICFRSRENIGKKLMRMEN